MDIKNNTSNCAISSKSKTKNSKSSYRSCLTKKDLLSIVKKLTKPRINIDKYSKHTLKNIIKIITGYTEEYYHRIPLLNPLLKQKLIDFTFKIKVKGINKVSSKSRWWLTNIQIDGIMKQFVKNLHIKKDYSFVYFDTVSADTFDKYPEKITQIKDLLNKHKKIGIIFNLDTLSQPGSHWIAVYLTKINTLYYDSTGKQPSKYIQKFLDNFNNILINRERNQFIDGSCGMHSIVFLISKVIGNNLQFSNLPVDTVVNKYRSDFFIN